MCLNHEWGDFETGTCSEWFNLHRGSQVSIYTSITIQPVLCRRELETGFSFPRGSNNSGWISFAEMNIFGLAMATSLLVEEDLWVKTSPRSFRRCPHSPAKCFIPLLRHSFRPCFIFDYPPSRYILIYRSWTGSGSNMWWPCAGFVGGSSAICSRTRIWYFIWIMNFPRGWDACATLRRGGEQKS